MRYGNRSPLKKVLSSPITLIVAALLVVVLGRAAWNIHQKAVVSGMKLDQAQAELTKTQASETDLQGKVAELSTPEGVEAEIRTKYRAVRPGESVAVIVDDPATTSTSTMDVDASASISWWGRLMRFFGF